VWHPRGLESWATLQWEPPTLQWEPQLCSGNPNSRIIQPDVPSVSVNKQAKDRLRWQKRIHIVRKKTPDAPSPCITERWSTFFHVVSQWKSSAENSFIAHVTVKPLTLGQTSIQTRAIVTSGYRVIDFHVQQQIGALSNKATWELIEFNLLKPSGNFTYHQV
jgi:hypothetical protein